MKGGGGGSGTWREERRSHICWPSLVLVLVLLLLPLLNAGTGAVDEDAAAAEEDEPAALDEGLDGEMAVVLPPRRFAAALAHSALPQ